MPAILQGPFAFLLVLGVLVFLHELGHFLMAKLLRIGVEVFSFGFGPRLFGLRWRGTDYRVSLLPLGGYVRMRGENPDEEVTGAPEEFLSRPKPQRFLVLIMGAAINLLVAVALATAAFRLGVLEPYFLDRPVVVGGVEPGAPAEAAGIRPGDRILAVDGREIPAWREFQIRATLSPGQEWRLTVEREGERLEVPIRLAASTPYRVGHTGIQPWLEPVVTGVQPGLPADRAGLRDGDRILTVDGEEVRDAPEFVDRIRGSAGVRLAVEFLRGGERRSAELLPEDRHGVGQIGIWQTPQMARRYPLRGALRESLRANWESAGLLFTTLRKLVAGDLSLRALSGPIDIYKFSAASYREGVAPFLAFMAMVSLQLGIINLLPIPILDGGHIFILLVEGILRRDLSLRLKERVIQAGFLFLILFMGIVLYLDVQKARERAVPGNPGVLLRLSGPVHE